MKYILFFSFYSTVIFCNSQDLIIKKCVNDKINESIIYKYDNTKNASFYRSITEIENYLMQNTNQESVDKRSFHNIINFLESDVYDNDKKLLAYKNKIQKSFLANNIQPISIYGNLKSFSFNCYYVKIDNAKGAEFSVIDETLADHIDEFQKISAEGYSFYNKYCFNKLINSLPNDKFDRIIYRVPLILMIYENIITKSR